MSVQALVDKAVIGVKEIKHAPVFLDNRIEEHLRFANHGGAQGVVKIGKSAGLGATLSIRRN